MLDAHTVECCVDVRFDDLIVRDHLVHGERVLPGVVFLDLICRVLVSRGLNVVRFEFRDVLFLAPVVVASGHDRRIRLRLVETGAGAFQVTGDSIRRAADCVSGEWRGHFRCSLAPAQGASPPAVYLAPGVADPVQDFDAAYAHVRAAGIEHHAFMKAEGSIHIGASRLVAPFRASALARLHADEFYLHPACLDASTLVPFLVMPRERGAPVQPFIPIHIERFRVWGPLRDEAVIVVERARTRLASEDVYLCDILLTTSDGAPIVAFERLSTKRIRSSEQLRSLVSDEAASEAAASTGGADVRAVSAPPAPSSVAAGESLVRALVSDALGHAATVHDPEASFYELGLTSADLIDITAKLEVKLDTRLYPTLLFEHGSIAALGNHLEQEHASALAALTPVRAPPTSEPPALRSVERPVARGAGGDEPIAIVGLAGRYPGSPDLDAFWRNLASGVDLIREVPLSRWDHARWFDPTPGRDGRTYGRWGGFCDDIDQFDPIAFHIAPREAELMDPQERLFLETAWEALEDAAYARSALAGRRVGVFVGVMWGQYELLGVESTALGDVVTPMSFPASIANRVSYFFDLRGPSLAVDTMCSSSLTALHLACESLRRGECEACLVGGVNLILHPSKYLFLAQQRMLASDGRCRAFGQGGDGYVPGEGVGAVLLKPLSRAERDGDHIKGVILATAINHGGRANGYTVPDPDAQAAVIREALARAAIDPASIQYVEAHGTGTSLGDPIELRGLAKALGSDRGAPVRIGSVKSNIGHLEAAAGIAGLTKILLQLRHRQLAPTLHAVPVNPHIDWSAALFRVQTGLEAWPTAHGSPRRAGLSAFGAGGSNAHALLEEYPATDAAATDGPQLVALSARTDGQLRTGATRLLAALDAGVGGGDLARIAYTLLVRQDPMAVRAATVVHDVAALRAALRALVQAGPGTEWLSGQVLPRQPIGEPLRPSRLDDAGLRELAARWVNGAAVEVAALYPHGAPRRCSLPTYPFERRRCWLPQTASVGTGAAAPLDRLHPLVHRNTSSLDGVCFTSEFTVADPLLADHRASGTPMLPGAAILEMALVAAKVAGAPTKRELHQVVWKRPLALGANDKILRVSIGLRPTTEGLAFTISDGSGDCAQGLLLVGEERPAKILPLAALRTRLARPITAEVGYARLADAGLTYGPSLRTLGALLVDGSEALAELAAPGLAPSSTAILPPALIDGALQAVGAAFDAEAAHWLPYALECVTIHGPVSNPATAFLVARTSQVDLRVYDILIADADGSVSVELVGLAARRVTAPAPQEPPSRRAFSEQWREEPLAGPLDLPQRVLVLAHDDALARALVAEGVAEVALVRTGPRFRRHGRGDYEVVPNDPEDHERLIAALREDGLGPTAVVHAWLRRAEVLADEEQELRHGLLALAGLTRAWALAKPSQALCVLCVAPSAARGDMPAPIHAGLEGLLRTAGREHSAFRGRLLSCDSTLDARTLLRELQDIDGDGASVGRVGAVRMRRRLVRAAIGGGEGGILREGGVYLITGGGGGIGALIAGELARRVRARLVLVGRRPPDPTIEGLLAEMRAHAAEAVYESVDISREAEVAALIARTLGRWGALHGVIHSAGVLRDARIVLATADGFREVLASKRTGTRNLDHATAEVALDFFAVFSSLSGMIGNLGQAGYAFANRYLDAFAGERTALVQAGRRRGRTVSIAWPLWRDGGMRVDAATEGFLFRTLGMRPLGSADGVGFFLDALALAAPVVGVMAGDVPTIDRVLGLRAPEVAGPPPAEGLGADTVIAQVAAVLDIPTAAVDRRAAPSELGLDLTSLTLLCERLRTLGARSLTPRQAAGCATIDALIAVACEPTPLVPPSVPAVTPVAPPPAPTRHCPAKYRMQSIRAIVAELVKLDVDEVDPLADLRDFGFDSISIVQLASRLGAEFGTTVSPAVLFELASIEALAEFVGREPSTSTPARAAVSLPVEPLVSPGAAPILMNQVEPAAASRSAPRRDVGAALAIVGMSGRFPKSPDISTFWRHLAAGDDLVEEVPASRWDWRRIHGDPLSGPHRTLARWGGFIAGEDRFDAAFFRMAPREAELMDPQHRLFLETAWHALEDAAIRPSSLAGTRTGVFVGIGSTDYHDALRELGVAAEAHTATGRAHSVVANRLSFLLDLHGPSLAVETACSSSLVALISAMHAMRRGECDLAIVGGVNLMLSPHLTIGFSRAGMLSPDGRCRTFDARANGYVRGEGVGAVVLKPLTRAEADGDRILAILRGGASSHAGRANALTAPNARSQAELLVAAYEDADVDPATVGLIEAHGTGTQLGDPVEVRALVTAFERLARARGRTMNAGPGCALGSVKTNIGHLETAAGIAGLLKAVLCLQHRHLVPTVHFEQLNPDIDLARTPFDIPRTLRPWPAPCDASGAPAPRRAGVSSFGFGGTNAHVVLEESIPPSPQRSAGVARIFPLSARSTERLEQAAGRLREFVEVVRPELDDLAFTLQTGRDSMSERVAIVARDLGELSERLDVYLRHGVGPGIVRGADAAHETTAIPGGLASLAAHWVGGGEVDWSTQFAGSRPRRIAAPGYPFASTRHWLLPPAHTPAASDPDALAPPAAPALGDAKPGATHESVRTFLVNLVAQAVKLDPAAIDLDGDLADLGLDSVLVIELNRHLRATFGDLPATLLYKYKSLQALAAYLVEAHASTTIDQAAPNTPRPAVLARQDIAIIGMSGRYPGARDLAQFWENLRAGRDSVGEVPLSRWDWRTYFDPEGARPGSSYSKWGGFLNDVDRFDAAFFQIAPKLARAMDPQERIFLETAWACVEDAGYTRATLPRAADGEQRAQVGVFVGVTYNEYASLAAEGWAHGNPTPFSTQAFSIANRVSYTLALGGPSVTVDTACASSLSALHLACESLRTGDCTLAIAGGVNLSLHPNKYAFLCANRFASTDGRCRSFGAGGDGYVPGEGVGAVLLRPLVDALRDGDAILGVIKGSATNHDGKTQGYTVPNPVAQTEVILAAWRRADVDPRSIQYIEAHGTGTALGDPIEITGLTDAFERFTKERQFCAIGSVKSNIGHLESAAGIAQLHKVLLQLRHRTLVPNLLHSDRINDNIDFPRTPLRVQTALEPWPIVKGPLRVGISSFGAGGVNVHVVVESAPEPAHAPRAEGSADRRRAPALVTLSARSTDRLSAYAAKLADHVEREPALDLQDLAYTLQIGREPMMERLVLLVHDREACITALRAFSAHGAAGADGVAGMAVRSTRHGDVTTSRAELLALARDEQWRAIAAAWASGRDWPWAALHEGAARRRVHAPSYPFAGEAHWIDPPRSGGRELSPAAAVAGASPAATDLLDEALARLRGAALETRGPACVRFLQRLVAAILEYPDDQLPGPESGFFELGMESVHAAALVARIEAALGVELHASAPFDHPNVGLLAVHIVTLLSAEARALEPRSAPPAASELVLCAQEWQDAPSLGSPDRAATLVVIGGDDTTFAALREAHGSAVRRLPDPRTSIGPHGYDRRDPSTLEAAVAAVAKDCEGALHILHLERLDGAAERGPVHAFATLFHSVRGLFAAGNSRGARLVHAYPADSADSAGDAAIAAFARALALEASSLSCQALALDQAALADPRRLARLLLAECCEASPAVRILGDRRQVRRLVELTLPGSTTTRLRDGGVYLITGGAGKLGLLVAQQLARRHRPRLVLIGRSELEPARRRQIDELRERCADLLYLRADIGDGDAVRRVCAEARARFGAVHGVFHAAGVLRDGLIRGKRWEDTQAVLAPKVTGTLALDEATRDDDLDAFVLFSSTAALTGNTGQTDYSLANAFLGEFAERREDLVSRGLRSGRCVAIHFPLWADGGMQVDERARAFMASRAGLLPMPSDVGLAALDMALGGGRPQVGVFYGVGSVIRGRLLAPMSATDRTGFASTPDDRPVTQAVEFAPATDPAPDDAIAIVGMACRFPGGIDTPEALWQFLVEGRESAVPIPRTRWDQGACYDPRRDAPGKTYARAASLLTRDPALFDHTLFGVSPREAEEMDPQHRLLLEVSWEAIERAGLAPSSLRGTETGVFVGLNGSDYAQLPRAPEQIDAYTATGVAPSIAAGRIAHIFGLQGPVMTVDTACSSSLLAVHLARESLLRGESRIALAGGASLMLSPLGFIALARLGALAPDGRCKAFRADADGYGRGEGCGVLVLKRLADARRDGDHVLAVLLGSAVNHDGASSGLTVPNGRAQRALILRALQSARLAPSAVSFVEAHGTGTPLGDPIEAHALGEIYGVARPADEPLLVGAVKANLGHLEAAAGVAGLLKAVLCAQHGIIPGQPGLSAINPRIDANALHLRFPATPQPWRAARRIAGVSSFGFSGTNVHLLVEAAGPKPPVTAAEPRPAHLLTLSAATLPALAVLAHRWRDEVLRARAGIAELCAASLVCRSHLRHRAAIVAADSAGLERALLALAEGIPHADLRVSAATGVTRGAVEFAVHLPEDDETVVDAIRALAASSTGLSAALARHTSEAGRTSDGAHDGLPLRAAITVAQSVLLEDLRARGYEPAQIARPADAPDGSVVLCLACTLPPHRPPGTRWLAACSVGEPWPALLRALAELHVHGITPEPGLLTVPFARPEALPTYPFQRQRHWLPTTHMHDTGTTSAPFDVLDGRLTAPGDGALELHYDLSHARLPELADNHGVFHIGQYVELVARAARRHIPLARIVLRDVHFERALRLTAQQRTDVRLLVEDGAWRVLTGDGRRAHARGHLAALPFADPVVPPAVFPGGTRWDASEFYAHLASLSFELGESVRKVSSVRFIPDAAVARLVGDGGRSDGLGFHPGALDACAQLVAVAGARHLGPGTRFMVVGMQELRLHRSTTTGPLVAHLHLDPAPDDGGHLSGAFIVLDEAGEVLVEVKGLRVRRLAADVVALLDPQSREPEAPRAPPGRSGLVALLNEQVAGLLHMAPAEVPTTVPLRELGMDSIVALGLKAAIERTTGAALAIEVLIEGPSVAALAGLVEAASPRATPPAPLSEASTSAPPVAERWFDFVVRRPRAHTRLFCFPHGGSGASVFRGWSELGEAIEVTPVQLPGRERRLDEPAHDNLAALLDDLVPALRDHGDLPFAFYGHSMGGLVAYEAARRLQVAGGPMPRRLFVGGFSAPCVLPNPYITLLRARLHARGLSGIPGPDEAAPPSFWQCFNDAPQARALALASQEHLRPLARMVLADLALIAGYEFRPTPRLTAPVTVFQGDRDDRVPDDSLAAWVGLTSADFELVRVSGDHFFITDATTRATLSAVIRAHLAGG